MISNEVKIISENKKAYFNYEVLEKFEAGISLFGQEVKSLKIYGVNLAANYVILKDGEVLWVGANIASYQPGNTPASYNPERSRKLLLKKSEIKYLIGKSNQKGLTFIPLRIYTKNGKIKLEFAIVKGKKQFDKRELIKKREAEREIRRALKGGDRF